MPDSPSSQVQMQLIRRPGIIRRGSLPHERRDRQLVSVSLLHPRQFFEAEFQRVKRRPTSRLASSSPCARGTFASRALSRWFQVSRGNVLRREVTLLWRRGGCGGQREVRMKDAPPPLLTAGSKALFKI